MLNIKNEYEDHEQKSLDGYYRMVRKLFTDLFTGSLPLQHEKEIQHYLEKMFNLSEQDYAYYSHGDYRPCTYGEIQSMIVRTGKVVIFLPSSRVVRMKSFQDAEIYGISRILDDEPIQTYFHHEGKLFPGALVYITKLLLDQFALPVIEEE